MRYYFLFPLLLMYSLVANAGGFDNYFENNTLRVDYIFTGTQSSEIVSLDKLVKTDNWAGRRNNLDVLDRQGYGQITVMDVASNKVIYRDAFSSLFQEWQSVDESKILTRSFENVFLIPFPKKEIKIEVSFRMRDGSYKTLLEHKVDPSDILIQKPKAMYGYNTIHVGGKIEDCINVVFVPEGYAKDEMDKFMAHANSSMQELFKHAPFGDFKNKFNFYALDATSSESGVAIPRNNVWKKTLVGSHFDTFYSQRYLTTSNVKDLHDALVGVPYSHIIILANTDIYGGGGIFNAYTLTTTGHPMFAPVVVHEFGHSFAGLADEYFYEGDTFDTMYSRAIEPWEANISTLVDFDSKWKNLLKPNTPVPTPSSDAEKYPVGVYEGAGYMTKGMYRAAYNCRMRTNEAKDFCPACQGAIEQIILFYTE